MRFIAGCVLYDDKWSKKRSHYVKWPVAVAAPSRAWAYGRSPAANVGSNPTGGMDVCLL